MLDFSGPDHQIALRALHPGVRVEQVQEATGFALHLPAQIDTTPDPTAAQMELLQQLDPHNLRASALE